MSTSADIPSNTAEDDATSTQSVSGQLVTESDSTADVPATSTASSPSSSLENEEQPSSTNNFVTTTPTASVGLDPTSPERISKTNKENEMDIKPAATQSSPPHKASSTSSAKATPSLTSSPLRKAPSSSSSSSPPSNNYSPTNNHNSTLSPPRLPPAAAVASLSPSSSLPTSSKATPQMMVLGRDGSDYHDLTTHRRPVVKDSNHPGKSDKQISLLTNIMSADDEHNYHLHNSSSNNNNEDNDVQQQQRQQSSTKSSWWKKLWGVPNQQQSEPAITATDLENGTGNATANHSGVLPNVFPKQKKQFFHISMGSFDSNGGMSLKSLNNGKNKNDNGGGTIYYQGGTNTDDDEEQGSFISQFRRSPPRQSLLSNGGGTGGDHSSLLTPPSTRRQTIPNSAEDQLLSECSFFYRPVDDEQEHDVNYSPRRRQSQSVLRLIVPSPNLGVGTRYRDTEEVLAPPEIAEFQAKYQLLNQENDIQFRRSSQDGDDTYNYDPVPPGQQHGEYNNHDLFLNDEQEQQESAGNQYRAHSLVTNVAKQSTLFYRDQGNGRIVLRLPRDHVRLVMDPHLEPGILSVVQSRKPNEPPTKRLQYCLTVPNDLYRNLVSEMTQYSNFILHSDGSGFGGGGLDSSFYASDHVDIRVALAVLAFVFLILGLFTVIFHEK